MSEPSPGAEGAASPDRRHVDVRIEGRVQGVGYRVFAADAAERHGIVGWVSNEVGGRVRAVGEGTDADLSAWLVDLRRGPAAAFVTHVVEGWGPASGRFDTFEIRSGWHAGD